MIRPSFMMMPSSGNTAVPTAGGAINLPQMNTPAKFYGGNQAPAAPFPIKAANSAPMIPQFTSMDANLLEHLQLLQKQASQQQPLMLPGFPRTMFDGCFYQYPMMYPTTNAPAAGAGLPFASPLAEQRSLTAPPIGPSAAVRPAPGTGKSGSDMVYFDQRAFRETKSGRKNKRVLSTNDDSNNSDTESASTVSEEESSSLPIETREKRKRVKHAPGQGGTRRLKIDFLELGEPGDDIQYVGKCGSIIPHGLRGRHEMHNQPWEFTITHEKVEGVTVIQWSVKNLTSNKTVTVSESPFQARVRQKTGNTITSFVMRQALEQRVRDLEETLEQPDIKNNPVQVANVQSLIKELRRKERNEGILFFGLRHEEVQRNRVLPSSSFPKDGNQSSPVSSVKSTT